MVGSRGQPQPAKSNNASDYLLMVWLCPMIACSVRGEWLWSYPDPDEAEGEEGEGEGEGSGAEDSSFALALNDEVRFRVRTLEFTQVGFGLATRNDVGPSSRMWY